MHDIATQPIGCIALINFAHLSILLGLQIGYIVLSFPEFFRIEIIYRRTEFTFYSNSAIFNAGVYLVRGEGIQDIFYFFTRA